jgi:RNA ligase
MHISKYLDVNKLNEHIEAGIVEQRRHPFLPLSILTYSRKAVYDDLWDDVTTKCRGLIVHDDGNVVSRPFEKFFNISTTYRPETWLSNLPKEKPVVAEKLDGSLGILYEIDGKIGIASKGSFVSEHAIWATNWYKWHVKEPKWPEGHTVVFEMICQDVQHHVVHYDGKDRLVLLAIINNETGEETDYNDLWYWSALNGMTVAEKFEKGVGTVLSEDRPNTEGYVLSWPRPGQTPLKVKVKHETFLKLQKIVHAATPKAILEALMAGELELIDTWQNSASDELAAFVCVWTTEFLGNYGNILVKAKNLTNHVALRGGDRRGAAEFLQKPENREYASVAFAMMDGKDHKKVIWKMVANRFSDEEKNKAFAPVDEDDGDKE